MNSAITQCPECSTRFKVSDDQLAAHHGIVRCGRCSAVFNATEHLYNDEPSPQLSLPIVAAQDNQLPSAAIAESPDISATPHTETVLDDLNGTNSSVQHILSIQELPQQEVAKPMPKQHRWPWIVGSTLMLLLLLGQTLYFFRVELAAHLPGLKPALTSYCTLFECTVPLPKKADMMSIESSDLEADPLQANLITLSALLHNRASYTQAYPNLELSLTDMQDKVVARRVFVPLEYLKAGEDEKLGLAANREVSVKLRLDTTDLKPTGYKLFLFYTLQ